jgi:hypothetical protein
MRMNPRQSKVRNDAHANAVDDPGIQDAGTPIDELLPVSPGIEPTMIKYRMSQIDPELRDACDHFPAARLRVDSPQVAPGHSAPSEMADAGSLGSGLLPTGIRLGTAMKKSGATFALILLSAVSTLGLLACTHDNTDRRANPIVGTWFVTDPGAPFPYHMYVFNSDGTMQQANPDAGDPHSSDSDGKGVWVTDGDRIKGKWVEVIADRASHKFTGRAEISYDVKVNADTFTGTVTASSYDANGTLTESASRPTPLEGKRVTLR